MSSESDRAADLPREYPERVKFLRARLGLTQVQLAQRVGVSFATINRWENRQSRPTPLAWQQIIDLERAAVADSRALSDAASPVLPKLGLDFAAKPEVVSAVAEAHRLTYGHLFNPSFATEISLIDPLPHQRIAVYEHMLAQSPLRFLLADDAGAGKTIMTGLYLREAFARRLIKRVLVVPPAGLVGNWRSEMRTLFRLPFRIVNGADARNDNPFVGADSDRVIVSVDSLRQPGMFSRLRESVASGAAPYDLVVFDEAHKLAANREPNFYVRKTERYRLAEALAGLPAEDARWDLGWSAANILLLTATPHMGKDFPYYALWRLLAPDVLATFDAFNGFPEEQRRRHFIRRTKEEMVRFDGQPLYPQRQCDTLSYDLGADEQALYEATTYYINNSYNKARILNRSAARLAMSVFQRRQASSTYALMRSFERRLEKLDDALELVGSGRSDELERRQKRIADTPDFFDTRTADEDADETGEQHEEFEDTALGGLVALNLQDLKEERGEVETLLGLARKLSGAGEDSKFEKLRGVLRDPNFAREKFIVFTEHRDTAEFLVRKLEGLGFTGQVALIHGGLDYRAREAQVELFRKPLDEGGANYLVATDAAGEGINLQFCWLMVNYDVPWNPARLEQRMGRIHRYGQKHDPVVIVNLIAGQTREGRVLKTLLEKLELIRKQLRSDKVFDVVGRLFQNVSLQAYLLKATTDEGAREAIEGIEGALTLEQTRAIEERDHALYGGGDVKSHLAEINAAMEKEQFRRLLPGYIRRFVESAAPLIDLHCDGDPEGVFEIVPTRARAIDPVLGAMEFYPAAVQGRFTVYRPQNGQGNAIWLHPGEPVFDRFCATLLSRLGDDALRGAVFIDPTAKAPYLFHLAQMSVVRKHFTLGNLFDGTQQRLDLERPEILESRLIGLRQDADGTIVLCPVEHLLLLRGMPEAAPGSIPLARLARGLVQSLPDWLAANPVAALVEEHRARCELNLPERLDWVTRGFDFKTAELIARRQRASEEARSGDARAKAELTKVKDQQRSLTAERDRRLAALKAEPALIAPGEATLLAHALVVPTSEPEEQKRYDTQIELIAMQLARAHEEAAGATVYDVSKPELARRAGLNDWPGFDLHSRRPPGIRGPAEDRAIEVKGCASSGGVEITENEWANACTQRDRYWLYVAFDCATPQPRLVRVKDPFGRLLARAKGSMLITATEILSAGDAT
jgi:superfamily II DNA or RNA helicase/DNA-binding XRE family transcriptional regulator